MAASKSQYIALMFVGIAAAGAASYAIYTYRKAAAPSRRQTAASPGQQPVKQSDPQFQLEINKEKNGGVLTWLNLPSGTKQINIFRSSAGENAWSLWTSVAPSGSGAGSSPISFGSENSSGAGTQYYFSTSDSGGNTTYSSPDTNSKTGGGKSNGDGATEIGSGFNFGNADQGNNNPPPSSNPFDFGNNIGAPPSPTPPPQPIFIPPPPVPTSTPTSTPDTSAPLPTGTVNYSSVGIFYTPDGKPSGVGVQEGNFWAVKIDSQSVELGWQNLASSTNRIVISRASAASGPWSQIMEQNGVDPLMPNYVTINDSHVNSADFYKLEAYQDSTLLQPYGPTGVTQ